MEWGCLDTENAGMISTSGKEKKCMNLNAVPGDKVRFVAPPHHQHDLFKAGENAERLLKKGQVYTVKVTHSYDFFTFVELKEFSNKLFYATDFEDAFELLKELRFGFNI
ncbi:MAG: hypothetical protein AWM53_00283 [Candidatus Dichloromethanomonas elyunquensis]|nr:MAG: hypothetical protein AWM53_00283 [Candidatus Dichloromethanomonas elyunquensis]